MSEFILTLDATSTFSGGAPDIDIIVDGEIITTLTAVSGQSVYHTQVSFSGDYPAVLKVSFNNGSGTLGDTIMLNSLRINGFAIDTESDLNRTTLAQGENATVTTETNDHLFGIVEPTISEYGENTKAGTGGNDNIQGSNNNDTIDGGGGNDLMKGRVGDDVLFGGAGDDEIIGHVGNDVLSGGNGNDLIFGREDNDLIFGGNENDKLFGDTGHDVLNGGDGDDKLFGGAGNDILYGGLGDDLLDGQEGNDILYGEAGNDEMHGGSGNDTLYGGNQKEIIFGGADNDYIDGGAGDDKIFGDDGDDTIIASEGSDRIDGGAGNDTISFVNAGSAVDIRLDANRIKDDGEGGIDDILNIENVIGTRYHDTIYGNSLNNIISGGENNDNLNGLDGADILNGDDGKDRLDGGAGNDTLNGGAGKDRLIGGDGDDELNGGDDDDSFSASAGSDTQNGGAGDDILMYDADDVYIGGTGTDKLRINSGDSSILNLRADPSRFTGIDEIRLNNKGDIEVANELRIRMSDIDEISDSGSITVKGDITVDTVDVTGLNTATDFIESVTLYDGIYDHYRRGGNDIFIQQGLLADSQTEASILGTGGDDDLTGTDAAEGILGLGGHDTLTGGAGVDQLSGGDGHDTLYYDSEDAYSGGAGEDTLKLANADTSNFDLSALTMNGIDIVDLSNSAANILNLNFNHVGTYSDANSITIMGDVGTDEVIVSSFNENNHFAGIQISGGRIFGYYTKNGLDLYIEKGILTGTIIDDAIVGTTGDDNITGTALNEIIAGDDGNDTIDGGAGIDEIYGRSGDDVLYYDSQDIFDGGSGDDTLAVKTGDASALDTRTISMTNVDHIDLSNSAVNTLLLDMSLVDDFTDSSSVKVTGDTTSGVRDVVTLTRMNTTTDYVDTVAIDGDIFDQFVKGGKTIYLQKGLLDGDLTEDGIVGTGSGETITGTALNEAILAGDGNDTIDGGAGADALYAEDGDDLLYFSVEDTFDGGTGNDTLALSAGDASDFDVRDTTITGIENIDLTNGEINTMTIRMVDILNMSDDDILYVTGDAGDTVNGLQLNPNNHYVETVDVGGIMFDHYLNPNKGGDLYVQEDLTVL